jgi:hypothetical protein
VNRFSTILKQKHNDFYEKIKDILTINRSYYSELKQVDMFNYIIDLLSRSQKSNQANSDNTKNNQKALNVVLDFEVVDSLYADFCEHMLTYSVSVCSLFRELSF